MNRIATKTACVLLFCLPLTTSLQRAQAADESDTKLVEAIGGLSAAYVYQTYLCIGMIGDGVTKKSMEADAGKQLLGSVIGMSEAIEKQLNTAGKSDKLSAEDKKGLAEFEGIIALLRTQGKELAAFWETNDASHSKNYETARTQAWDRIKAALGIKD